MHKVFTARNQFAKWHRQGSRDSKANAIHDVVLAGDIPEAMFSEYHWSRLGSIDVQQEIQKLYPNIRIKEGSKGGWFWTAVRDETENRTGIPGIEYPHWRGFQDTMIVKDAVRESTKHVTRLTIQIIESLDRKARESFFASVNKVFDDSVV